MDDLSIASLQKFMTSPNLKISQTYTDVEIPFDIHSSDFLTYAEYDVNNNYEHHLINALSNIKRAIDCQVDSLLFVFGLYKKSKEENWRFPYKLSILKRVGIASPRILNKINTKRNQLEHQYSAPKKEEVEDALDVAILFNAYTDRFVNTVLIEAEIYDKTTMKNHNEVFEDKNNLVISYDAYDSIKIEFDYNKSILLLTTFSDMESKHISIEIPLTNEEYIDYLKIYIDCYRSK